MKRFSLAIALVFVLGTVEAQAATFTVTNINSTGAGSLERAIIDANSNIGLDNIVFSIPSPGPHTILIAPGWKLPTITDPVIIDGYTQPGASPNTNPPGVGKNTTLMIELDGTPAGNFGYGLLITSGGTTVRGLVINRFRGSDILIRTNGGNVIEGNFIGTDITGTVVSGGGSSVAMQSDANVFGGTDPGAGNVLAGGVFALRDNTIQGNFMGVNITGTATFGIGFQLVTVGGPNNIIGGPSASARNIISGGCCGIRLNPGSDGTVIQGNYIGTDVSGTLDLGNSSVGIFVRSSNNTIGGSAPGTGNVISGNGPSGIDGFGIFIFNGASNVIQGNFIGTDATGTAALGNTNVGIRIDGFSFGGPPSTGNIIGGAAPGAGNVISANGKQGIFLNFGVTGTLIQGNLIGTDVTGTLPLGNATQGVLVGTTDTTIGGSAPGEGNTIAFNGGAGVFLSGSGSTAIEIRSNDIFENGLLGIDLTPVGVTLNDPGDGDTGANSRQNFPVVTLATSNTTSTTITGTFNSIANTVFTLEFFSNTACDPSGFGEGESFLGSDTVTTDGSGNVTFTSTFPVAVSGSQLITSTATDSNNNTSEFSACAVVDVQVTNSQPIADAGPDQAVNEVDLVTLDGSASSDPDADLLAFQWLQIAGPTVALDLTDPVHPIFFAPFVPFGGATITFELTVDDGLLTSDPDVVNITVSNVNNPPVADAGGDQTVQEGSPVTLDGSASFDGDSEPISFSWTQTAGPLVTLNPNGTATNPAFTAPFVAAAGETLTFSLTVNDGIDDSIADTVNVFVTNVNQPPVADAGADQTKNEGSLVTLDGTGSSDPDSDPLTFLWVQVGGPTVILTGANTTNPTFTAPFVLAGGAALTFELTVSDGDLTSGPDGVTITVLNVNDPPSCNLARAVPDLIWPPNHKLVSIEVVGVTDPDDDAVILTVTGVTQDEALNGLGDGDTSPDAVITSGALLLRAERSGNGNGRVYEVTFSADDGFGGICAGTVSVCVPHKRRSSCVDDGQGFDSTQP